jgi:hypothetical protein
MRNINIAHSTRWTPAVFISSGSPLAASMSRVDSGQADVFVIGFAASNAVISSNLNLRFLRLSSGTRRPRWGVIQSTVAPEGIAASELAPDPPPNTAPEAGPIQTASKPSRLERIELAIDSLQNYELIKPIPVLVESLGDKVFVAEAPDLNISTTGNSVGAAFLLLKEQILSAYEGNRSKRVSDSDRARLLAVFEKYIGRPRRHWF